MRPYLIIVAKGLAAYVVLYVLLGGLSAPLYETLPDEGIAGSISAVVLMSIALIPAPAAGYLVGRLAKINGMFCGALSITLGATVLHAIFSDGPSDMGQYLVVILIGALAGGCGELHANRQSA